MSATKDLVDTNGNTHHYCTHHSLNVSKHDNNKRTGQGQKMYSIKLLSPLLIAFGGVIILAAIYLYFNPSERTLHRSMAVVMAAFFSIFGGLKALSWKQFAVKFALYDIIAKQSRLYAYCYPGLELLLAYSYWRGFFPSLTNAVASTVLLIGAIGIWKKLQKGTDVTCACIGAWFTIPLTKITLAENIIMGGMALVMILM